MARNNHIVKLGLFLLAALLLAIFIGTYIFPIYFSGDDADLLLAGKYFCQHISSIFSLSTPLGQIREVSRMLMWYYYRPLDRILWAASFALFGFNPTPLHAVEIFLFIIAVYNLFKVTNYISGLNNRLPGFICIFSLLALFYPFDKTLLTFLAHGNTFLMLFFMSFSFVYFLEAYQNNNEKKMAWGMFFALLAFFSKEWSFYAIPAMLVIYFYLNWAKADIAQRRIALKISAFLFISLTAVLILQFIFRKNPYAEKTPNLLDTDYFLLNLQYFISLSGVVFPILLLSLVSLWAFRNKGQLLALIWSVIMLLPALFYKNLCVQTSLHYLFLTVMGLSIFIGIGIYLVINESYLLSTRKTKIAWYDNKYPSNLLLLFRQLFLLPIALFCAISVSANTYKYLKDDIRFCSNDFRLKNASFKKALASAQDSLFFVTDALKQKTYMELLYAAGRNDVQVRLLDINSIEQAKTGQNLIRNGNFETDLNGWVVNFKRMFSLTDKFVFNGAKSLEIDLEALSKISNDFVEVVQEVKVKPGQLYLFGGWANLSDDFSGHFWIEVKDKRDWRLGNYVAMVLKEPNVRESRWKLIQNYFIPKAENLVVVACRGYAPVKGKIYISGIFLYPANINLLD